MSNKTKSDTIEGKGKGSGLKGDPVPVPVGKKVKHEGEGDQGGAEMKDEDAPATTTTTPASTATGATTTTTTTGATTTTTAIPTATATATGTSASTSTSTSTATSSTSSSETKANPQNHWTAEAEAQLNELIALYRSQGYSGPILWELISRKSTFDFTADQCMSKFYREKTKERYKTQGKKRKEPSTTVKWDADGTERLNASVDLIKGQDFEGSKLWNLVAESLDGKWTAAQCMNKYYRDRHKLQKLKKQQAASG
jgi:hypothetical protein